MTKQFNWRQDGAGFRADMPAEVTLYVTPEHTQHFGSKAKRGTTWRCGASQWDGKSTISRFGRDEYGIERKSSKEAMKAAEAIYLDAIA